MTTYVEVAQALVTSGYVSDADLEAATAVLADALVVSAAADQVPFAFGLEQTT